jgi:hypothetical protein
MANYTKATNFAAKDGLPTGNAGKVVKGTEIDTEFTSIASAIASKADSNSPTFTGTPVAPTASSTTNTTQIATTAFVQSLGGRIVQAVTATFTGTFSSTSTSFVTTGHSVNITPTSASNKILIIQSGKLFQTDEFQPSQNSFLSIFRDTTNLAATGDGEAFVMVSSGYANSIYAGAATSVLDSPNTVSQITYSVRVKKSGSNATAVYAGYATITALEITP